MLNFKDFLKNSLGFSDKFDLEHRLFNLAIFFGIILCFQSAIINSMIGLHFYNVVFPVFSGILLIFLQYLSIKKRFFKLPLFIVFIYFTFIFIPIFWFIGAGVEGSFNYFILIYTNFIISVFIGKKRWLTIALLITLTIGLAIIEYYNPELVIHYNSKIESFIDHLISISLALLSTGAMVIYIKNSYIKEKNKAEKYLSELEKKNREIEKNNIELEKKNRELWEAQKKLIIAATKDPLTGLSNRRDMIDRIQIEISRFSRNSTPFSIIMGDIDHFKTFNDSYGHDCGDFILKKVSKLISKLLRKQDSISRWGGEEFLILLPETDISGALTVAERINKMLKETKFDYQEFLSLSITITLGISKFENDIDMDECIKRADMALYAGKEGGRDNIMIYDENIITKLKSKKCNF